MSQPKLVDRCPENPSGIVVVAPRGLGDSLYVRPFLKGLLDSCKLIDGYKIYLNTPWPELFKDMEGLAFTPCATYLRTQNINLNRYADSFFQKAPDGCTVLYIYYEKRDLLYNSIPGRFSEQFLGIKPTELDMPDFEWPISKIGRIIDPKKVAVIRPSTVRREWMNISRNAKAEYIAEAARALKAYGYFTISVCDIDENNEWLSGDPPEVDLQLHKGELASWEMMGLMQKCGAMVGGVGFMLPLALASGVPTLMIGGGQGIHNGPKATIDFLNSKQVQFIFPDEYCMCDDMMHECKKTITNFAERIQPWIQRLPKP